LQLNTEGTLFFLNEPFERVKHPLEYVEAMDIQSINKYGSTEQKLIEKVLSELLSLLVPTE